MKSIDFILNGKKWVVKFVSQRTILKAYGGDVEGCVLFGFCKMSKKIIYVDKAQSDDQMIDTIFHELGHACFEPADLGTRAKIEEELACNLIASGMSQLYQSGDLMKLLTLGRKKCTTS